MKEQITQKEALDMLNKMDVAVGLHNLLWYSKQGDLNKVELLLISGVNPNEVYQDSKKNKVLPLHNVCLYGTKESVELLFQYGANVNQKSENGNTALHEVIEHNKLDIAKLLIEKGADVNVMTKAGTNPLYIAEQKKNTEMIDLLKKAGAKEMTQDELKTYKKNKLVGRVSIGVVLVACIWFGGKMCSGSHNSSSGGDSSSSSGITHTCLNCGKTYSGYGYATMAGEEYALTSNSGDQYCSRGCAKASRTGKFKNL